MFSWFRSLASPRGQKTPAPAIPMGQRVYIVGDIHGRYDLLRILHEQVEADSSTYNGHKRLVYLGDYIDRGHESKKVVEELVSHPLAGFDRIFLKGNHEDALLNFLVDFNAARDWFQFGGEATVFSYGVAMQPGTRSDKMLKDIQADLDRAIPAEHIQFFNELRMSFEIGDYFCVHAGIHPSRPLHRQRSEDLMWIRDEFLESKKAHEKIIVHGHSISETPDEQSNRIGIDTGAYYSNCLTCLVLEATERRFLQT
ncbi:MAG: serine/threonine protein phosphatase [Alphaproteobacteria bacterium]|nr:serine/threonine protein phosphatase [Alphaproteobacteria bacterium]